MASLVLTDAFVSLGGTDISTYVRSVSLPYSAELVDDTTMGDTTRINKGGLKNWSIEIELQQDFTDNLIDEIIFALVGTTFTVIVRPVGSSVVGTSNPNYTGTGILESYQPFGQAVGELATSTITIQSAGTLSRATA
jgi:hypothetical protein